MSVAWPDGVAPWATTHRRGVGVLLPVLHRNIKKEYKYE